MELTEEQIAINRLMCGNTAHSCKADYIKTAIKALEEIQQYRAIGTVEELEEAKIQFDNINSIANSVSLLGICGFDEAKESMIATVKTFKSDSMPIIHGKAELDIQEIRAKSIDEFVKKVEEELEELRARYEVLYRTCKEDSVVQYDLGRHDGVLKAIGVVRKAGVNNDN